MEHIKINLEQDVRSTISSGLEAYRFTHHALPEMDLADVDTRQILFGKQVRTPVLISSMTGGTEQAGRINRVLAEAAEATGAAMGLGSQRAAIEHDALRVTYEVRRFAPNILLFANLGAVQLNYGYGLAECQRAVDMVGADALMLHLNPLQEALQPEGDTRFAGLLGKIEQVCRGLQVPVVAKEVGWGISEETARKLASAGVAGIDVAGAGGTSWSQVEMHRIKDAKRARAAAAFSGWGIPTAQSIINARLAAPQLPVIASGGLKDGIDLAKCLALGACLGGFAGLFLKTALESVEATIDQIDEIDLQLKVCLFAIGAVNPGQLTPAVLVPIGR